MSFLDKADKLKDFGSIKPIHERFNLPKRTSMNDYIKDDADKKFQYKQTTSRIQFMLQLCNKLDWITFEELWSFLTLEEQEKVKIELNPEAKHKRQKTDIKTNIDSIYKMVSELKETFETPLTQDDLINELMKNESDFKLNINTIKTELRKFSYVTTRVKRKLSTPIPSVAN